MDGCIRVWWSNNCIHPGTERCLRLIWESSPSLELKTNAAQGTTSFLCTSRDIPGPVYPFSNMAVPILWTGNCLCKGLTCSLCHWNSVFCVWCLVWDLLLQGVMLLGALQWGLGLGIHGNHPETKRKQTAELLWHSFWNTISTDCYRERGLGLFLYSCCFLPAS